MNEKFVGIKKLFKSKLFLIIVASVVVLYIVLFPHTKTTKVNAELTGVFVVTKERYLLHTRVEFENEFVCMPGDVIKSQTIKYRLGGAIKSIGVYNCDGTYGETIYNSNGTVKSLETTTFIGSDIRFTTQEFNKYGTLDSSVVSLSGTVTTTTSTYYDYNVLKESSSITEQFGVKTAENISKFNEDGQATETTSRTWLNEEPTSELIIQFTDGQMTEKSDKTWLNGDIQTDEHTEYSNGDITEIGYYNEENNVTAAVTCDDTGCILRTLTADDYTVQYDFTDNDYNILVDGETISRKVTFLPIDIFGLDNALEEIEIFAQAILDAQ